MTYSDELSMSCRAAVKRRVLSGTSESRQPRRVSNRNVPAAVSHNIFTTLYDGSGDVPKLPLSVGDPGPNPKHGFFGPPESISQTEPRSVQPFLAKFMAVTNRREKKKKKKKKLSEAS